MEIENLIKLIETVSASELTGFKYEENGVKLHLAKKKDQVQVIAAPGVNMNTGAAGTAAMAAIPAVGYETGYGMNAAGENASAKGSGSTAGTDGADSRKTEGKLVESPLVGTFYAAPAEDAAPFVSVGDTVKKGQTLAIIEAMKLMNEIESEYDGTITEILVENGQPVEYGQPLFRIG